MIQIATQGIMFISCKKNIFYARTFEFFFVIFAFV